YGPAKRVPDEDDTLYAGLLQSGDPGQDIERTFRQDVGVPVAQPQGSNPFLTQRFREPRIGALAGPAESPPGTPFCSRFFESGHYAHMVPLMHAVVAPAA